MGHPFFCLPRMTAMALLECDGRSLIFIFNNFPYQRAEAYMIYLSILERHSMTSMVGIHICWTKLNYTSYTVGLKPWLIY